MADLTYRLSAYEGPLDLLYKLIQDKKIDIFDIPIALLTEQYLDFLDKAEDKDMDSMSEFALMAATLLEIKSKMLLPKSNAESVEDPRQQLVDTLLEYRRAKMLADIFRTLEIQNDGVFFRSCEKELLDRLRPQETPEDALKGVTSDALFSIFKQISGRKERVVDKIRSTFKSVHKDAFTIEQKSEYILSLLELKSVFSFKRLLSRCSSKPEMVVTFLAVLELIKIKEIAVFQANVFEDIEIRRLNGKCV